MTDKGQDDEACRKKNWNWDTVQVLSRRKGYIVLGAVISNFKKARKKNKAQDG